MKLLKIIFLVIISLVITSRAIAQVPYSIELKQRAYLGEPDAMHQLSVAYRVGKGVTKDVDRANYWLERASEEGNPNAIATMELLGNTTSLSDAKRRELAAVEKHERERLLKAKEEQRLAEERRKQEEQRLAEERSRQEELKKQVKKQTFTANGVSFTMVEVQGGTFTMGGTSEQGSDAKSSEKPAHKVTLSSYYIGETEVTQELWQAVMGKNPSKFKGDKHPVEKVSWDDCQKFITKLNEMTGKNFRLPTEAEWEFAARGGSKSRGYKYSGSNNLNDVAWLDNNSYDKMANIPSYGSTHAVGTKQSNELGLYDMSGNVWEWCGDNWYNYSGIPSNYSSNYVNRGGGWDDNAKQCRVSNRNRRSLDLRGDNLGLRLAL